MKEPRKQRNPRFKDGIPVDAIDWTEADWQDLHEAVEKVKQRIRDRHKKEVEPDERRTG